MLLFLIRHGVAEDAAPGQADRDRALTERGVRKLKRQLKALKKLDYRPEHLLSSPYVRCVDTASFFGVLWSLEVETDRLLEPGFSVDDLTELIGRYPEESLAIVGHEPDLSTLVSDLTGARVKVRKGTVAVIELHSADAPEGLLLGLYDPDVLAELGK